MHWKRSTQSILRTVKSTFGASPNPWGECRRHDLKIPVPAPFSTALFNFTIDFELFWGNGNLGGFSHTLEKRIHAAERQAENFFPFFEMLKRLEFPISWAVLGRLVNADAHLEATKRFRPAWHEGDWYELPDFLREREALWRGRIYLEELRKSPDLNEILSHGYAHIDYSDQATSPEIAWADMALSKRLLVDFGLQVDGFVFPCNACAHGNLIAKAGFPIARGPDKNWHRNPSHVLTPVGFWISPGICNFRDIRAIVQHGIENRSFIHPWMHLIECELRCRDIDDFYRPFFELILEKQAKGKIKNISFREIAKILLTDQN